MTNHQVWATLKMNEMMNTTFPAQHVVERTRRNIAVRTCLAKNKTGLCLKDPLGTNVYHPALYKTLPFLPSISDYILVLFSGVCL